MPQDISFSLATYTAQGAMKDLGMLLMFLFPMSHECGPVERLKRHIALRTCRDGTFEPLGEGWL